VSDAAGRDDAINRVFEFLVDDDLEGFAIAASIDGDLKAMSFTTLDEDPEQYADADVCRLPRNELLGKLLADFSVMYGRRPEDVADVATHVAVDHLGVDDEAIGTLRRQIAVGGSSD
jgi:hypothetical protein